MTCFDVLPIASCSFREEVEHPFLTLDADCCYSGRAPNTVCLNVKKTVRKSRRRWEVKSLGVENQDEEEDEVLDVKEDDEEQDDDKSDPNAYSGGRSVATKVINRAELN